MSLTNDRRQPRTFQGFPQTIDDATLRAIVHLAAEYFERVWDDISGIYDDLSFLDEHDSDGSHNVKTITDRTAETSSVLADDLLLVYDSSAAALRKMTIANATKVTAEHGSDGTHSAALITARSAITSPVLAADYALLYDVAGAALKKVVLSDLLTSLFATGTWTPTLTFATPGNLSVAYSTQAGSYIKLGRYVYVTFNVVTSTFTHTTASGALILTGLAHTCETESDINYLGGSVWRGITKANFTDVTSRVNSGEAQVRFSISGSGQTPALVAAADMPTGGTVQLIGSILYRTTS